MFWRVYRRLVVYKKQSAVSAISPYLATQMGWFDGPKLAQTCQLITQNSTQAYVSNQAVLLFNQDYSTVGLSDI